MFDKIVKEVSEKLKGTEAQAFDIYELMNEYPEIDELVVKDDTSTYEAIYDKIVAIIYK